MQSIFDKEHNTPGKETELPVIYPPEFPVAMPEPKVEKEINQPAPLLPEIIPDKEPKTYPGKE